MRRIVITGMGGICALGHNTSDIWQAMTEGRSGIGPVHHIEAKYLRNNAIAAEISDFDPLKYIDETRVPFLDPLSQYALVAARESHPPIGPGFPRRTRYAHGDRGRRRLRRRRNP